MRRDYYLCFLQNLIKYATGKKRQLKGDVELS